VEALSPHGIEAKHPDFLVYQMKLAQGAVCAAVKGIWARLKKPPRSVEGHFR
jgi:hypothetical protein